MPNRSNFYGNSCMFLGSLQRGLILRHPHVTFPLSKVGLHMAKILANIGVIDSYRVVQNHGRIKHSHYVRLPDDAVVTSTEGLERCPHLYLHLTYAKEPFRPLAPPASGNALHSPMAYTDRFPLNVTVISKPTRKISYNPKELDQLKARYGPGILFITTRKGVLTDVEAEMYNCYSGVPLGHIALPIGHVAKLRAIVRQKQQIEQQRGGKQPFVSLADWPVRQMMIDAANAREAALLERMREELPHVEQIAAARKSEQIATVSEASDYISELKKQLIAGELAEDLTRHPAVGGGDIRGHIRNSPESYLHRDEQNRETRAMFDAMKRRFDSRMAARRPVVGGRQW